MNANWMFELITAYQRFICETEGLSLRQAAQSADAAVCTFPPARMAAEQLILRATCMDLAAAWGARQHAKRRAYCAGALCQPKTLAGLGDHWRDTSEPPSLALRRWVQAFCEEIDQTHRGSVAQRAAACIRARFAQPLDVGALEREVGSHAASIRRAFRREFHMTLRQYQALVRVEHADELLRADARAKIEPVAIAVGWQSKKDLYRAFRQIRGCTPAMVRGRGLNQVAP